ncbi:hypothetical protein [Pseudanabaena sp. PCC 6802]|uniref:hypothetical protein n=1 Tax=Pseudanabaena sp. PCC 6802 TaxID=118173 RepID=UPI0003745442|nr:hypothetical protein [Pseudanabaena sp. PCC 6802]
METNNINKSPLCPSARPEMEDSVVFGVIVGTSEEPRLAHLIKPQPVTEELLALAEPVAPTEIFRFAASCAGKGCQHFDGTNCRLATRIVENITTVTETLPPCSIRPSCRWWQQEGKAACMRCPQIVTDTYFPSEQLRQAADPSVYASVKTTGSDR